MNLHSIVLTLQFCLETFEQSCSCGLCVPCTQGQERIKETMQTLERLTHRSSKVPAETQVQYALERKDIRIDFPDRPTLIQFVRELIPSTVLLGEDAANHEIAGMARTRNWTLVEYQPGEYVRPGVLLHAALHALQELLLTTELNMDDLEDETRQAILRAADFENLAALHGFVHDAPPDTVLPKP